MPTSVALGAVRKARAERVDKVHAVALCVSQTLKSMCTRPCKVHGAWHLVKGGSAVFAQPGRARVKQCGAGAFASRVLASAVPPPAAAPQPPLPAPAPPRHVPTAPPTGSGGSAPPPPAAAAPAPRPCRHVQPGAGPCGSRGCQWPAGPSPVVGKGGRGRRVSCPRTTEMGGMVSGSGSAHLGLRLPSKMQAMRHS